MSGGLGFIDIILFAVLAAFLIYRLGSVLGKRTGHEQQRPDLYGASGGENQREDNVISLPDRTPEPKESVSEPRSPLEAALTQIKLADRTFEASDFITGATAAFEMIVNSFAEGDTESLQNLLSDEVYENFAAAIHDRVVQGRTHETTVVCVDVAEIIEAEMQEQNALVTVKYVSEQVNVTRESNGDVVEGDPSAVIKITDIWTFARSVSSSDPNWTLVSTRSPN
tara:strand:- start:798 stop:1472 length:675 start_codon:yes stop_codon:yes gene_type:complete